MPCLLRLVVALAMAATLSACSNELVVLIPEPGDHVGRLEVRGNSSAVVLDSAYAGARAGPLGVTPVTMSDTEVSTLFSGALAAVPPAPVTYTLYFEEGTTSVVPESRASLDRMLADVRGRNTSAIQVTGHTDRVGTVEDNDRLARERAAMVRSVLVRQGLDGASVRAVGRGERAPLIPTDDEVREPRNRRVEIIVR